MNSENDKAEQLNLQKQIAELEWEIRQKNAYESGVGEGGME